MLIDLRDVTAGTANQIGGGDLARSFSGALVTRETAAAQTIFNFTQSMIIWSDEVYDVGGWWAPGSPTKFTVPDGVRRVRVTANVRFDGGVSGDSVFFNLAINVGVNPRLLQGSYRTNGNVPQQWPLSTISFPVSPADEIELEAGLLAAVTANIVLPAAPLTTAFGIEAV